MNKLLSAVESTLKMSDLFKTETNPRQTSLCNTDELQVPDFNVAGQRDNLFPEKADGMPISILKLPERGRSKSLPAAAEILERLSETSKMSGLSSGDSMAKVAIGRRVSFSLPEDAGSSDVMDSTCLFPPVTVSGLLGASQDQDFSDTTSSSHRSTSKFLHVTRAWLPYGSSVFQMAMAEISTENFGPKDLAHQRTKLDTGTSRKIDAPNSESSYGSQSKRVLMTASTPSSQKTKQRPQGKLQGNAPIRRKSSNR